MIVQRYTFKKAEKLCSKKVIDQLIRGSNHGKLVQYPFICIFKEQSNPSSFPAQILISVSKKYSKKAVLRNRVKRQIREIYRSKKHRLYEVLKAENKQLAIIIFFIGKGTVSFNTMEDSFEKLFTKLIQVD